MSFYTDMTALAAEIERKEMNFERDSMALVTWLHKSVREALEWPAGIFLLANRAARAPAGSRQTAIGYVDSEGFHFGFAIGLPKGAALEVDLTIVAVTVGDRYTVKAGAETFELVLNEGQPLRVIAYVKDRVREAVKAAAARSAA